MCTQKVPYCYMPINIFVIALLKNMNLVCPVIAAFAEISTSFNTKLTHTLIQGGRIKMRSPPKVLTGNFRPSQLSFFLS